MKNAIPILLLTIVTISVMSCSDTHTQTDNSLRGPVDTTGFAHLDWQMDSVMKRINKLYGDELKKAEQPEGTKWKVAISPHDDYTYAGWLYPAVLRYIKAKTVIIFGVAHKARNFNLENHLIFDSFRTWRGPYKPVRVSDIREELIKRLPAETCIVHDSMQAMEHSVEALVPFLQYFNPDIEIVSILVPYTDLKTMDTLSSRLAEAIFSVMNERKLKWGDDLALLITSDAVHYGDEDWGGENYAPYGTDSTGYRNAIGHEQEIIDSCLTGILTKEKAEKFYHYTVSADNYKQYIWTWCGRYCLPMGLETAEKLGILLHSNPLTGLEVGYSTSIGQKHVPVNDLRMGTTAVATSHHWVGYPAIGYL